MSNIDECLNKIKNESLGKNMRQAIHDGINQSYQVGINNTNILNEIIPKLESTNKIINNAIIPELETTVKSVNGVAPDEYGNVAIATGGGSEGNIHSNVRLNEFTCYNSRLYFEINSDTATSNLEKGLTWYGFSPSAKNLLLLKCNVDTTFVSNSSGFYEPTYYDPDRESYIDSIIDSLGNEVTELKAGTYLIDVDSSTWKILAYNSIDSKSVMTVNGKAAGVNRDVTLTASDVGALGLTETARKALEADHLKANITFIGTNGISVMTSGLSDGSVIDLRTLIPTETQALSTYGEGVEVNRTCFEITPDMIDVDRSYTDYEDMGNGSTSAPTWNIYLNGNYTFDKIKQYLYLNFPSDVFNLSESPISNYSNEAWISIYNADGSSIVDDLNVDISQTIESEYDFVNYLTYFYFYYLNGSWNLEGSESVVKALKYTGKSEKGYLYIPSKNKAIEKIIENPNILDEILAKINS